MKTPQIIAWILLAVYVGIGAVLIYLIFDQVNCSSSFYYSSDMEDCEPFEEYEKIIGSADKSEPSQNDMGILKTMPKNYPIYKPGNTETSEEEDERLTVTDNDDNISTTNRYESTDHTIRRTTEGSQSLGERVTFANTLKPEEEKMSTQETVSPGDNYLRGKPGKSKPSEEEDEFLNVTDDYDNISTTNRYESTDHTIRRTTKGSHSLGERVTFANTLKPEEEKISTQGTVSPDDNYLRGKPGKPGKSEPSEEEDEFLNDTDDYDNISTTNRYESTDHTIRGTRKGSHSLGERVTLANTLKPEEKEISKRETVSPLDNYLPVPLRRFENRYCSNPIHGVLCTTATILIGLTIILYRLFVGRRTRLIKYFHALLHIISLLIMCCGIWQAFDHEYSASYSHFSTHNVTSWVIFVILILQIIVALFVFICLYQDTLVRLYASVYHDLFGIWIFICLVGCCLSGRRSITIDYTFANLIWFYTLSCAGFTIVLIIALSPYFEWDLEGPI